MAAHQKKPLLQEEVRYESAEHILHQVLEEQLARIPTGNFTTAKEYFVRFPKLLNEPEYAVDIIYNEYVLREHSAAPGLTQAEYLSEFPDFAEALQQQFLFADGLGRGLNGSTPRLAQPLQGDTRVTSGNPTSGTRLSDFAHAGLEIAGRYKLVRFIGEGGFARVYEAKDIQLQRTVALKIAHTACASGSQLYQRFSREAALAAQLSHPGIVQVYEFGEIEDHPFIVQHFVPLGDA